MSKLNDLFNEVEPEKPKEPEGIDVDITFDCLVCGAEQDRALYDQSKKKVTVICKDEERHISVFDIDLSFIYG